MNCLLMKYSKILGNQEAQYYTDRLKNVRCEDQRLIIEAHREDYEGRQFTSARLKSKNNWTYGRLQVYFKTCLLIFIIIFRQKRNYRVAGAYGRQFGW